MYVIIEEIKCVNYDDNGTCLIIVLELGDPLIPIQRTLVLPTMYNTHNYTRQPYKSDESQRSTAQHRIGLSHKR